ncbi:MAG: LuxR C-terminal-related transcriptional regulator, partial [Succiniclasticum sp.]|nr:LuxR C-terminal-related transcriptional regulator [Succiniclasticum sp.]
FPLGTGYIYGYLHYLMCRWLPSGRRGLCIGLGFALPNLLQFLVDWLLKITAAPPLFLWGLLLVVLAFMATLLLRTKTWGFEEQPVAPRPLITRNLPLLCCICAIMGLLVGLNDTVSLVRYDEYVDYHFLSRVYSAIGFLLAGWLADHYPLWLPLTALLSKAVVLGFHVLALEGYPFWITVCGDAFFTAALNLFVVWLFVSVALHTRRPELWAGMSRAAELPVAGLAGMLGSTLLQAFPPFVTLLVFVAALLLAMVLYYRCFLLYSDSLLKSRAPILLPHTGKVVLAHTGETVFVTVPAEESTTRKLVDTTSGDVGTETIVTEDVSEEKEESKTVAFTSANSVTEKDSLTETANEKLVETNSRKPSANEITEEKLLAYKNRYGLSVRETDVLAHILKDRSINEIAEELFISPSTVKFHVANLLKKTGAGSQRRLKQIVSEYDRFLDESQNKKADNE